MLIGGTRWRRTLASCGSMISREIKVTLVRMRKPEKWAFIIGCYNSGTTLLASLLGSRPDIAALPHEGQFLTDQLPVDYELGLPRMWILREDLFHLTERSDGPDAVRIKKEWLMRLDRSRPVYLEKSPPNAARTRWLQRHFENAHFIGLVRDGYAVSEGIRRKAEPYHMLQGWPIQLCARQWNRSNQILLEDAEHLRRILWVRYEDLTERPDEEVQRILDFLELKSSTIELEPGRTWLIHERQEPIRNLNAESIARLTSEDIRTITTEARDMLAHFGYPLLG